MTDARYAALVAESKRVGWPARFETDLTTHNRAELATRPVSLPFAWVLYAGGTCLIFAQRGRIDRRSYAHDMPGYCRESFGSDCRWYFWTGDRLEEVESAEALAERLRAAAEGMAA